MKVHEHDTIALERVAMWKDVYLCRRVASDMLLRLVLEGSIRIMSDCCASSGQPLTVASVSLKHSISGVHGRAHLWP